MAGLVALFFHYQFWPGMLGGAFLLAAAIPLALTQRNKVDTLVALPEGLLVVRNHRHGSGILISRSKPVGLTLECVRKGAWDEGETVATLNLWDGNTGARHILGLWIHQEAKQELFETLKSFLESNGFEVQARNESDLDGKKAKRP